MMLHAARIVLLNGVGSSGKSTIARALQAITDAPFLHFAMDSFIEMLPAPGHRDDDGLVFERVMGHQRPAVAIHVGPVAERLLRGMRHAVAAMAREGNNLIVDEVMLEEIAAAEYDELLRGFQVHRVGAFCPLEVLEARESARGDREVGLARWQYDRVHRGKTYDLEVDTSLETPEACAAKIKRHFGL
jgi:chloramphenicol 3-O phosphotransferase